MVLLGGTFLAVGVVATVIGVLEQRRWRRLLREGRRARGPATAFPDSDGCASLEVTFADEAGASHRVSSKGASTGWTAYHGQEVEVIYEVGKPEQARLLLDLRMRRWVALVLGLVFCGIGLALVARLIVLDL